MKQYLIFDLEGTLTEPHTQINTIIYQYVHEKIDPILTDHLRYIIEHNQGIGLKECFTILLDGDKLQANFHANIVHSMIHEIGVDLIFFIGVIDKIRELSKKYTLFLTTGTSDNYVNKVLRQGGIHTCFHKILGSSYITKSPEHIDELIRYTGDDDFCNKSIFIGDSPMDRHIAQSKSIDFIHIGSANVDDFEIQNITEIDKLLDYFVGPNLE